MKNEKMKNVKKISITKKEEVNNVKEKEISFYQFLLQKSQWLDFAILAACCLLAYIIINYCYPYPFTFEDSGGYVDAADKNIFYVYRPFGYSYFLQILHSFTTNIHSIFIVQVFLFFLASYLFALTVKYFFTPTSKRLWYSSLLFLIFAPTSFIMANWILSDLLFLVQVYLILSLFIFIIKRKSWIAAILYLIVLFIALHVRYSALVFPFILIPFFLMKKGIIRWAIVLASIFVFFVFYSQTKANMKEIVRKEQFSTGFDGWVYANNIFYTLPHIDLEANDFRNPKLKDLHNFIMQNMDTVNQLINYYPEINAGFMWDNKLPLKQYLFKTMQEQQTVYLPTFVKLGSGLYKDYAIYIMTHYPFSFLRYYYFPNFIQTFYPNPGCISVDNFVRPKVIYEYYNMDENDTMQANHAFLSPKQDYHSTIKVLYLALWTIIAGIGITAIVKRKKLIFSRDDKIVFWGLFSFAVIYYASSIFAAPMEIRYVISMHAIQFAFCYVLLNKLIPTFRANAEKDYHETKSS